MNLCSAFTQVLKKQTLSQNTKIEQDQFKTSSKIAINTNIDKQKDRQHTKIDCHTPRQKDIKKTNLQTKTNINFEI